MSSTIRFSAIVFSLFMVTISSVNALTFQTDFNQSKKSIFLETIPKEISAMLSSREFSELMSSLNKKAMEEGKIIQINEYDVQTIGSNTFAYLFLTIKVNSQFESKWEVYGSLISRIEYNSDQNPKIDGLWFSPEGELPGGATVGN